MSFTVHKIHPDWELFQSQTWRSWDDTYRVVHICASQFKYNHPQPTVYYKSQSDPVAACSACLTRLPAKILTLLELLPYNYHISY